MHLGALLSVMVTVMLCIFGVRGNDQANSFPFGQGWGAGPVAPNLYNDWSAAEHNDARRPAPYSRRRICRVIIKVVVTALSKKQIIIR